MSRTAIILAALVGGVLAGLVLRALGPGGAAVAAVLKPIGGLWLSGLQTTLVPLVFCLMTVGVASIARTPGIGTGGTQASGTGAAGMGRVFGPAISLYVVLLLVAATLGALLTEATLAVWPVRPIGVAPPPPTLATPGLADQLVGLIPVNPIASAAQGAMVPLIVFAALLGAATARLPEADGRRITEGLRTTADALLVVVGWVLRLAPVGILVLALEATASLGFRAAAGLAQYLAVVAGMLAVGQVCALGLGLGVGPRRFLRALAAPVAMAAGTQSSMACLPALLRAAEDDLGLPRAFVGALMPLTVTVFRFVNLFGGMAAGLFGAALFGVHPGPAQIGLAIGVGVLTSLGVMGLPGAAVMLAAFGPIFSALGAPFEALTLLIAVYALPDIVNTTGNVTADLAVVAWLGRLSGQAVTESAAHRTASHRTASHQAAERGRSAARSRPGPLTPRG